MREVGPYVLQEELGAGASGTVFRAEHPSLRRLVALKILDASLDPVSGQPTGASVRRFQREIEVMVRLRHPALVKLYDAGQTGDCRYIAMELIDGKTLAAALGDGPVEWQLATAMMQVVAEGLDYLHGQGTIHRDIKPTNILISKSGEIKLADFGLALDPGRTFFTGTGNRVGTPRYMAPEYIRDGTVSPAMDLWAVGCVFYEMLTACPHLSATSVAQWISTITGAEPIVPPDRHVKSVPRDVSRVVMELLERHPTRRTGSANELVTSLATLLEKRGSTRSSILTPSLLETLASARARTGPASPGDADSGPDSPARSVAALPPAPRPRSPAAHRSPIPGTVRPPGATHGLLLAIAAVCGLLACLTAFAVRPRKPVDGAVTVASPATPPSPSGPVSSRRGPATVQEQGPSSAAEVVFGRWRACVSLVPRLGGPRDQAVAAVEELRRSTGLQLGPDPETWLRWIRLGEWLDDPQRAATPPIAGEPQSWLTARERKSIGVLWHSAEVVGQRAERLVSETVVALLRYHRTGWPWIVLGRILEREGAPAAATVAYTRGLGFLGKEVRDFCPCSLFWESLAAALSAVPGHDVDQDWPRWVALADCASWRESESVLASGARSRADFGPWTGLVRGLDAARAEKLLRRASAVPGQAEEATVTYAFLLSDSRKDPEAGRRLLEEALAKNPSWSFVRRGLAEHLIERGRVEEARSVLAKQPEECPERSWVDALTGSSCDVPTWQFFTPGRRATYEMTVRRRLERDSALTADELSRLLDGAQRSRSLLPLDLLGLGVDSPGVLDPCRRILLTDSPAWTSWAHAAGALSSGRGVPSMELLTEEARRYADADRLARPARTLWLSRRGLHRPALLSLESLSKEPGQSRLPPLGVLEVLVRALRAGVAASTDDRSAAGAAGQASPAIAHPLADRLFKQWREGRLDEALGTARSLLDAEPREPVAPLAVLWLCRALPANAHGKALIERARIMLTYHGHLWALLEANREDGAAPRPAR